MSSAIVRYDQKWKEKAIEMVSRNGNQLRDKSECWTSDRDIVEAAIQENPLALRYAPAFHDDKKMVGFAVCRNGLARVWGSSGLQEDPEIREIANRNMPIGLPKGRISSGFSSGERIFLSNFAQWEKIRKIPGIYNLVVYAALARQKNSFFLRDSQVTLFQGQHLIPYSFKDPLWGGQLKALLPHSSDHFLIDGEKGVCGKGYRESNVSQAMITDIDFTSTLQLLST
jgi:hypothetical protein